MPAKSDSSKRKFVEGERVLCFHGPLIYEAKCIKTEYKDGHNKCFIHYNGWNKSWDEWVEEDRVLKYNESNLQKQKDLKKQHGKDRSKKGKITKPKPEKESAEKRKIATEPQAVPVEQKKRRIKADLTVENEESFLSKVEVKIDIPLELQPVLVDDWDLINRQKQLYHLPARKSVEEILADYMKFYEKEKGSDSLSTIVEMVEGIKEYFNVMLGSQLLYKFERPQYGEIMENNPERTMSQLYGPPHFLRFFVRMGAMLTYTNLNEKNMKVLIAHFDELLSYIRSNSASLFHTDEYEVAPAEYHRKAAT